MKTKKWIPISLIVLLNTVCYQIEAQALRLPGTTNQACSAGRTVGVTDIHIKWVAPGVKGRAGRIWGTNVAYFGTTVLGFGSDVQSPWRAGADESTAITFSTDVTVNGKKLPAGSYGFFIELYQDSCILIFNNNSKGWGSYFYDRSKDMLRVATKQQKDVNPSKEWLEYTFSEQTSHSVEIALEWEHWRIPFTIDVDLSATTLAHIQTQMSGALGFDPPSLQAAANWCLINDVNYDQALQWITSATNPNLGGVNNFNALSVRAGLLTKIGKKEEGDKFMQQAMENATPVELHQYGRQLLGQKKNAEAMVVFEKNHIKNKGAWPTNVGMMRGYSATGNIKKALEHAKLALSQAPDEINRKNLEASIKTLESGKSL